MAIDKLERHHNIVAIQKIVFQANNIRMPQFGENLGLDEHSIHAATAFDDLERDGPRSFVLGSPGQINNAKGAAPDLALDSVWANSLAGSHNGIRHG
jgi:hypothetical protein